MPYCTYTDVASEFVNITFAAGQPITDTEVTEWIAQHDNLINSHLASRYEVPITGTAALSIMKLLSIALTKIRVIGISEVRGVPAKNTQTKLTLSYKDVLDMLKSYKSGESSLIDATLKATGGGMGIASSSSDCCSTFDPCSQQW